MLKTMCKLEAIALALAFVTSCGGNSSDDESEIDYIPVQVENDGKWGMLAPDGKMLFNDEFKNEPSVVVNGFFSVVENDKISLYQAATKPVLVPDCDDLVSVGVFAEGLIPVTHPKGRITLVDSKGSVKVTLNPISGKEIVECAQRFNEGMLKIKTEDGLYGFVDKIGKVVIEPKYTRATPFSEDIAIVEKEANDETVVIAIDKSGKEIFRLKNDINLNYPSAFHDGLLAAKNDDGRCGFINKKGEFNKVNGKVKSIKEYNSKYFVFVSEDYQCGVMDMDGNVLIRAKYGNISILSGDRFFAKDDKEYLILDKNGDKQLSMDDYSSVYHVNDKFYFIAQDKSNFCLLDNEGKQIGKEEFKSINLSISVSDRGAVYTDFFNPDAITQTVLSQLTNGGYGKYSIGMPATSLGVSDYYPYTYEYCYTDSAMYVDGWRYEVNFRVYTDKYIAVRETDSFYNSTVIPNKESKVDRIVISVRAEQECWSDIKEALFSGIQSKGYKLKESNDEWAEFDGKDCVLNASSNYSGRGFEITINIPSSSIPNDTVDGEEVVEYYH